MAPMSPSKDFFSLESVDALSAGALGFMPRLLILTTLPHRRPESHRFERVNGRHSLRLSAPRRVGLPYGSYPRLILVYLTTEAVRTKSPEIQLGAKPNDLARKLGLPTISGPRGTAARIQAQLRRLLSMRLDWQTSLGLAPRSSGSGFVGAAGPSWPTMPGRATSGAKPWRTSQMSFASTRLSAFAKQTPACTSSLLNRTFRRRTTSSDFPVHGREKLIPILRAHRRTKWCQVDSLGNWLGAL